MSAHGQPAPTQVAASEDRAGFTAEAARQTEVRRHVLLSTPALIVLFCAASGPLLIMLVYSFLSAGPYGGIEWKFSIDGWFNVFMQRDIFNDILKDDIAEYTAVFAQRLFNAGAICHARTTTPEFCCAAVTTSRLWGTTRNPWNPNFTPGGSSGGSAASLAAGTSTLATGSDIAGSIRIPASCSGVVGFKPPYGRVPELAGFNLDYYCHEGPLARTIADTALMENVIAGPHPSDIATIKPKLRIPEKLKSIRGWRIGYSLDLGFFKPNREVRENTLRAIESFRAMGCRVEEVQFPWDESCAKAAWDHLLHLFGASLGAVEKKHGDLMTDYARAFAIEGRKSKAIDFVNAMSKAGEMYSFFGPMMENYDVFLCPTTAKPAEKANPKFDYASYRTDGKSMPDSLMVAKR